MLLVAGQCLCTQESCAYKDTSVPLNGKDGKDGSNGGKDGDSAAMTLSPAVSIVVMGTAAAGVLSLLF